jgi:hypothetical protein
LRLRRGRRKTRLGGLAGSGRVLILEHCFEFTWKEETDEISYRAKIDARYELIRFSSFSYRFLGASCAPTVLAAIHEVRNTALQAGNKKEENTLIKGAFRAHWKVHTGWSMGESMGMRSDASRAGSLRVAELTGVSWNAMSRI